MTGRVVDTYTNISTVKMFAHADREDAYAQDSMGLFLDTVHRQMRLVTLLTIALNVLNALLLFSVAGTSIWLWTIGAVQTGAIALSVGLVMRLQGMSHWIMWEVAGLFENVGVVQDGLETIARDRTVVDAADAKPLVVSKGEIRFENIRFDYGRDRETGRGSVIEDLTLTIAPGEKVGLVGRSGAGKSTLVSLLLRFYDLDGGRILIDGQDIAHVTQDSLRADIGMVTQDTSLLHRTVMDNILYGRPHAGHAEAIAAARKAAAHDFIEGLEDFKGRKGYDAHVGERGVKLSGGQRQRVAIARVLLEGRADPGARRGDQRAGLRGRGRDPGAARQPDERQDRDRHRPPAVDDCGHGPARHHGRGADRRAGQPRRAAAPRRPLRRALGPPVGWLPRPGRRRVRALPGGNRPLLRRDRPIA